MKILLVVSPVGRITVFNFDQLVTEAETVKPEMADWPDGWSVIHGNEQIEIWDRTDTRMADNDYLIDRDAWVRVSLNTHVGQALVKAGAFNK